MNSPFLSYTNPFFQKLKFLKLKDIVKLEIAKTMVYFNKSLAKNEPQTILSITQKYHYKTRLAMKLFSTYRISKKTFLHWT